jgi:hypothetical protein
MQFIPVPSGTRLPEHTEQVDPEQVTQFATVQVDEPPSGIHILSISKVYPIKQLLQFYPLISHDSHFGSEHNRLPLPLVVSTPPPPPPPPS